MMHKVLRFTALAIFAGVGLTACGDKINVTGTTNTVTPPPTSPSNVVQSVTISPANSSLQIGGTEVLAAVVTATGTIDRTVTWSSNDATIASVDQTGKVTALKAGTTTIIATSKGDPNVRGAATVIVTSPSVAQISISSITDSTGKPVNLTNAAGQVQVTFNYDPGSGTVQKIDLLMNCNAAGGYPASSDTVVATQSFTAASASKASPASAPVVMSVNTAAFNAATGTTAFKNGQCQLKGRLTLVGGAQQTASVSQVLTLNNADFIYASALSTTPSAGQQAQATDSRNRVWRAGSVTVNVVPVIYTAGRTLVSGSISLNGIGTRANDSITVRNAMSVVGQGAVVPVGTQTLSTFPGTVTFANSGLSGTSVAYSTIDSLIYTVNSIDNAGATGPSITNTANQFIRLDNEPPGTPYRFAVVAPTGYVTGGYSFGGDTANKFADSSAVGSSGTQDHGGVDQDVVTFYYAPVGSFTALDSTGPTVNGYNVATQSAAANVPVRTNAFNTPCTTTGFTQVSSASQIPTSLVNNAYVMRAVIADKLGNQRCVDLTGEPFGVDLSAPILTQSSGATKNSGTALGATYGFTVADTGSGPATNYLKVQTLLNFATDSADCIVKRQINSSNVFTGCGYNNQTSPVDVTGGSTKEGYYTTTVIPVDAAGNLGTPITRTVLYDITAPVVGAITQSPAKAVGAASVAFSAPVTDNVDLKSSAGTVNYTGIANGSFYYPGPVFNATGYSASVVKSGTATITDPFYYASMVPTAAGGAPGATVTASTVTLAAIDQNNNVGTNNSAIATDLTNSVPVTGVSNFVITSYTGSTTSDSVSKAAGGPITIVAQATTPSTTVNPPFARVDFYGLVSYTYTPGSGGAPVTVTGWVLLGSQAAAPVNTVSGANRLFTWTSPALTLPSSGIASAPTNMPILAVGTTAGGDAMGTFGDAATQTVAIKK